MVKNLGIIISLIVLFSAFALAQDKPDTKTPIQTKAWNVVCPVDGHKVDPDLITIKYNGHEYGFCSEACATVFSDDPATYAKNLNDDGTKFIGNAEGTKSKDKY